MTTNRSCRRCGGRTKNNSIQVCRACVGRAYGMPWYMRLASQLMPKGGRA